MNEKPVSKSTSTSPKMQQIERYGVIALVFLLVTIVAVSFWGDSKSPGFWSRLTGKTEAKKETTTDVATVPDALVVDQVANGSLPLNGTLPSTGTDPITLPPVMNGNIPTASDTPATGPIVAIDPALNSFAPNPVPPTNPAPTGFVPSVSVPPSGFETYQVQKGDSLALIAKRRLGAESRWTEIQAANPGLDPKRLRLGAEIRIPTGGATVSNAGSLANLTTKAPSTYKKAVPAAAPKSAARSYRIQKGDVLRSIARAQLGDENRWTEIQKLNPGLDARRLIVGSTIKLPAGSERRASGSSKPSTETVLVNADKPRVK